LGKFSILASLKSFFKSFSLTKEIKTVAKAGKMIETTKTVTKVLSWGNAAKVVISGAIVYWFFSGGLVSAVSSSLGVPDWISSILLVLLGGAVVFILLLFIFRWLSSKLRARPFKPAYGNRPRNSSGNYRYNNNYNKNTKNKNTGRGRK